MCACGVLQKHQTCKLLCMCALAAGGLEQDVVSLADRVVEFNALTHIF